MTKEAVLAGAVGSIFGRANKEVLRGDVARSALEAYSSSRPGQRICLPSSSFLPGYDIQSYPVKSREWANVPRDHSHSRHGNRRAY